MRSNHSSRQAIGLILVLVSLATIALLVGTITVRVLANRHQADRRALQLQESWLARAGIELACSRLLAEPATYRGESLELIPGSRLTIQVEPDSVATGYKISSEAHYPTDGPHAVMRSITRRVRRLTDGSQVRIESIAP